MATHPGSEDSLIAHQLLLHKHRDVFRSVKLQPRFEREFVLEQVSGQSGVRGQSISVWLVGGLNAECVHEGGGHLSVD